MKCMVWMQFSTMLVLLSLYTAVCRITVPPPDGLEVVDLEHLGEVLIHWALPVSLQNLTDCSVRFQLQYFDTYEDRWATIRTIHLNYRAQFDLEKDVRVRVFTMLKGSCVDGSEVLSPGVEAVLKPPNKGSIDSRVENFSCVFYQRELMECSWGKGSDKSIHPDYHLYYWHRGMEQTLECPDYIHSNGLRTGCSFTWESLQEFTEFNICVNGSSVEGPVRPAYFSLQIQNHVKPAAIETMSLEAQPDGQFHLEWEPPEGRVPDVCLEYEVESGHMDVMEDQLQRNITMDTTLTYISMDQSRTNCFRVRSRMHEFCADTSFWSEWSQPSCLPVSEPVATETILLCILAVSVILLLILLLCLWKFREWLKMYGRKIATFYIPYGPKEDITIPPTGRKV
ncbi:hypothetical protein AGOR_G00028950 [Albula goreensis]|uniref:Type I cytokine receptor cytokine-binding domain-containing protein n=1 Tax=Albula goreensis TaxID=1534307 RepID=A0A8T3E9L8_9TELE|nr:hypothetical protein AGOR_G00028950 [Albula goreensis]